MHYIQQLNKSAFDCGQDDLNCFIKQYANQLQKRNETTVYVALDESRIIGFFTLSAFMVMKQDDPQQMRRYSPMQPIPAVLIGRFAVDSGYQGKGLGKDLLAFALEKVSQLSKQLGIAIMFIN